MTLQALNLKSGEQLAWVAVPLELVDWIAREFKNEFFKYLASLDPYDDIVIPNENRKNALEDIVTMQHALSNPRIANTVPRVVDLFGEYGIKGARKTLREMLAFFNAIQDADCKVVSLGD